MVIYRWILLRLSYTAIFLTILFIIISLTKSLSSNQPPVPNTCEDLCPYSYKLMNYSVQFDLSHQIKHYPEFVCPQNFRNLADWIFRWPDQFKEKINKTTQDGKLIAPCLPHGSIIYVRIWSIQEFFRVIYPYLINKFVLITGEGDLSSPNSFEYLHQPDSKIIHWFGQNGQYHVTASNKFTHIPIGINCFEMAAGIRYIHSQQSNSTVPSVYDNNDEPKSYIQPLDVTQRKSNKNLVLINFDAKTDKTGLRSKIWYDVCTSDGQKHYPFITCLDKPGGVQIERIRTIYDRNRQYPFWLSPRGNGIDCHRTWEALYLDIIPIVWNSSLNILYENLPIVIINDYKELNEKFLYQKLNEITKKKLSAEKFYQYEKLRHAYWRRLILNKSRYKQNKYIDQRKNLCWRANTIG